jgi:hypothetical protein
MRLGSRICRGYPVAVTSLIRTAVGAAALLLLFPSAALAHGDGEPWLFVAADHVEQGQPFSVIGADMGPSVGVTFELTSYGEPMSLGEVTTEQDGHFEASLTVPMTVRDGYAELRAVDAAGLEASTWVLVGDEPDLSVPPMPVAGNPWWTDPSVIVLGLFLVGGALAVGYLLVKSRRRPVPARATERPSRVPRKPTGRRRRAH